MYPTVIRDIPKKLSSPSLKSPELVILPKAISMIGSSSGASKDGKASMETTKGGLQFSYVDIFSAVVFHCALNGYEGNVFQHSNLPMDDVSYYDKQKCKELWKKFEDAAISLSAEVVKYSHFERISSLGQTLIMREIMDRNIQEIEKIIAEF
ncbi:unnamed protein product [Fasciola hepatica]|uniref:Uncharacterized protein n=1 Tax=Fasciola hepatica TaxID=6192 RepID=A0ABC9HJ91_FASHE